MSQSVFSPEQNEGEKNTSPASFPKAPLAALIARVDETRRAVEETRRVVDQARAELAASLGSRDNLAVNQITRAYILAAHTHRDAQRLLLDAQYSLLDAQNAADIVRDLARFVNALPSPPHRRRLE